MSLTSTNYTPNPLHYRNATRKPFAGDEVLIGKEGPTFVVRGWSADRPLELWNPITEERKTAQPSECTLVRPHLGWNHEGRVWF